MSEIADLLRYQSPCDKEIATSAVTVTGTAAKFTSQLTGTYVRKSFYGYNNSDDDSGELFYGGSDVTPETGRPIPLGADIGFNISPAVDIYFVAEAGEIGDLRIFEGA